jgi:hypothetical protein
MFLLWNSISISLCALLYNKCTGCVVNPRKVSSLNCAYKMYKFCINMRKVIFLKHIESINVRYTVVYTFPNKMHWPNNDITSRHNAPLEYSSYKLYMKPTILYNAVQCQYISKKFTSRVCVVVSCELGGISSFEDEKSRTLTWPKWTIKLPTASNRKQSRQTFIRTAVCILLKSSWGSCKEILDTRFTPPPHTPRLNVVLFITSSLKVALVWHYCLIRREVGRAIRVASSSTQRHPFTYVRTSS